MHYGRLLALTHLGDNLNRGLCVSTVADVRFDCPDRAELESDYAWWDIYRESFPANERESPSVIFDAMERRTGIAFRARRDSRAGSRNLLREIRSRERNSTRSLDSSALRE
jgi:hypothetical protein